MRELRDYVGNAEKTAVGYILNNPKVVPENNIRDLAAKIYVSPSTIIRLCKNLGFEGYKEFRQAIVYETALFENTIKHTQSDIQPDDNIKTIVEKISYRNIKALEETANMIDIVKFEKCVDLICNAINILLFEMDASLCVAKDTYILKII